MDIGGPDKLRDAELISLDALSSGTMAVPVAATFGFDQLQAAHAAAADPDLFGRILLVS
jgi:NADPH:quinone reductase-like Zn-dependent oxidoreductase